MKNTLTGHCVSSMMSWEGAFLGPGSLWLPLLPFAFPRPARGPPTLGHLNPWFSSGWEISNITVEVSLHFCTSYSNHLKQKL